MDLQEENQDNPLNGGNAVGTKVIPKPVPIRRPRNILRVDHLVSNRGIGALPDILGQTKFKGKGHELEDLKLLLFKTKHWAHRLFPGLTFEDFVTRTEKLGSKREVKNFLNKIRTNQNLNLDRDRDIVESDCDSDQEGPTNQHVDFGLDFDLDDWDGDSDKDQTNNNMEKDRNVTESGNDSEQEDTTNQHMKKNENVIESDDDLVKEDQTNQQASFKRNRNVIESDDEENSGQIPNMVESNDNSPQDQTNQDDNMAKSNDNPNQDS